jgi:predicted nucleotidyltransferase
MIVNRVFDELFRTWSNVAVLRALQDTASGFTGNEVARESGMDPKAALNALTRLEELGIVRRQRGGRDHIFTLNRNHYLVERAIIPIFSAEHKFLDEIYSLIAKSVKGQALSIVLFGSVARREDTPQSDLDICCIVKNKTQQEKLQMKLDEISSTLHNRFGVKIGPVYFTLDEFRKKESKQNPLIRQILDQGKVIIGKNPKVLLNA